MQRLLKPPHKHVEQTYARSMKHRETTQSNVSTHGKRSHPYCRTCPALRSCHVITCLLCPRDFEVQGPEPSRSRFKLSQAQRKEGRTPSQTIAEQLLAELYDELLTMLRAGLPWCMFTGHDSSCRPSALKLDSADNGCS